MYNILILKKNILLKFPNAFVCIPLKMDHFLIFLYKYVMNKKCDFRILNFNLRISTLMTNENVSKLERNVRIIFAYLRFDSLKNFERCLGTRNFLYFSIEKKC